MKLYFSRREVARLVGVSPDTLRTWERYLPLRLHKRGREVLYTQRDVDLVFKAYHAIKVRGVSLRDVARSLAAEEVPEEVHEDLRARVRENLVLLRKRLKQLQAELREVLESEGKETP